MHDLRVISYTSAYHKSLVEFMHVEYPARSIDYIEWWISTIDNLNDSDKNKTLLVFKDTKIVACTTFLKDRWNIQGISTDVFYEANTIVSSAFRGCGIGRILYQHINKVYPRCTVGFTKQAWNIQSKIMQNFNVLNSINTYVFFSKYIFNSIFPQKKSYIFPIEVEISEYVCHLVNTFSNVAQEIDSIQFNNKCVIHDSTFLINRFDNIYRCNEYKRYIIRHQGKCEGYLIFRIIKYRRINMLSLVDYRTTANRKIIKKLIGIILKDLKLGFCLVLSSENWNHISISPLMLKTPKQLKAATNLSTINNQLEILFTSADSDLDFVYYE